MWGGIISLCSVHGTLKAAEEVFHSWDTGRGDDYTAHMTWRQDDKGNVHLVDVELFEPPHATLETRLVPGSNPPRYEPV